MNSPALTPLDENYDELREVVNEHCQDLELVRDTIPVVMKGHTTIGKTIGSLQGFCGLFVNESKVRRRIEAESALKDVVIAQLRGQLQAAAEQIDGADNEAATLYKRIDELERDVARLKSKLSKAQYKLDFEYHENNRLRRIMAGYSRWLRNQAPRRLLFHGRDDAEINRRASKLEFEAHSP